MKRLSHLFVPFGPTRIRVDVRITPRDRIAIASGSSF
jgi:hypothetical protein